VPDGDPLPALVLLDLDGTLTDSAPGILACLRHALAGMDRDLPPDADLRPHLGPPLRVTFTEHFAMSDDEAERAIDLYRERYHDVGLFENAVYPGIEEMLESLGAGSTLAVATSKPTVSARRILEHFGLLDRFAVVAGADLAGARESKADVVGHALELLGAGPVGTVMVGDRRHDVIGAAAHGVPTVGVLWGYGDAAELGEAGAAALADRPQDVPGLAIRSAARRD
jgi:phosphoglycolate phosphatase